MMGAMREIMVRHRQVDYAKEVWRMNERAKGEPRDVGLVPISHSQVCPCLSRPHLADVRSADSLVPA
jgi:hypothetical protein